MSELKVGNFDKIETIEKGTEIKRSQVGYYNYWYPSHDQDYEIFLEEDTSAISINWQGGGERWEPYRVTADTAKKYGSPIRVIWVSKTRGIKHD